MTSQDKTKLEDITIPIPPLETQKKIVERLEKAERKRDEAIAKAKAEYNQELDKAMKEAKQGSKK